MFINAATGEEMSYTRPSVSCRWCFTDQSCEEKINTKEANVTYLIIGREIGKKTKKPHHQGYVEFGAKVSLRVAKNRLGLKKAHFELARGTAEENRIYCSKEGSLLLESGTPKRQGERKDLDAVKEIIEAGGNDNDLADANWSSYLRYHKAYAEYRRVRLRASTNDFRRVRVVVLAGRTGCGKTRFATKYSSYTISGSELQWWDGYQGEKAILIDDYNSAARIEYLLRILDGHQLRLPIKGSFTYAQWTLVFITTNERWLHDGAPKFHKEALSRRISKRFDAFEDDEEIDEAALEAFINEEE